ncbi:hypothetical protein LEP1GSC039_2538 [Leptospira santarosai str. 2000027870]|nr:hypothetical protein LEP1GSC039_2538 [Leptospira santarosai str. 2000027870]
MQKRKRPIRCIYHQGKINWAEILKSEISFVYIKASEGGDFIEPVPKVT